MITEKHKLAYIEAKSCVTELKLMTNSPFYRNYDDTYQICILCQCPVDRIYRTVESITLRFYCTYIYIEVFFIKIRTKSLKIFLTESNSLIMRIT